ncbi:MFS transporter [Cryobacterium levicorallinum]|uniref:MFS transporter n=1 Tax=Cryobacterium levicorallinum TaxID=995038 RepID=A0A1I3ASR4_9MICO|nr:MULTISPECIES: MFS transporter [Cryobacterium]TFB87998.1 MFS transporter [Cryobacterium levicorallinum]GEP26811.1 putative transporter [Cryobacterium levicorallinum]SFH53044.1 Predicted arabinose efflux permease, MFS family [Cryobacterium levicorallinum]
MRLAGWVRGRLRASAVPEPGVSPKPRLNRDVIVLGVIAFFVMVGFGVVVPVLPVYVQSFGVGNLEVGAVVSAFALMRFVFSPACGRLIDWAGERTVLAVGIGIVALSSGLVGAADSYLQLLLLRGAGGIGSAMFSVSAMTLLLRTAEPGRRARAIGFYQGGFLIGGMAGPAIGSLLATISLTAPFFFYAGTLTVAGLVGLFLLRSGGRGSALASADASAVRTPFRTVLRDERFRAACLANFAQGWTSLGVRTTLIPLFVVVVLGGTSSWTGIALAAAAVAQALALAPAARFVDTVGRKPAIIGAFTVAGLAIVAISFAPNIWVLGGLLCVYGVAAAFMGTAPAAAVGDAAGARGGRPVSVFSMCADAGAIVGPLVAGLLVDAFSFSAGFAVGAVFLLIAAAYALRMPSERRVAA